MNVEIGADAAQFPEKEYINGIAFAVYMPGNRNCEVLLSVRLTTVKLSYFQR